ncbi:MAG TPA: nitroreductase family protein [Planctomycetota bacterium]|nr:nitroreductase family protein [Planctomycetota bacterium]
MDIWKAIATRRSVRAYRPDPLPRAVVEKVLDAARLAPSACNLQPWHFYAVTDAGQRAGLKAAYGKDWLVQAPVVIVACSRPGKAWKRSDGVNYAAVDVAIAFDHLTLAARAEGLGTCWIGAFKPAELRRALAIPDDLEPVAMTPLGYPAEEPASPPRKNLAEIVSWV